MTGTAAELVPVREVDDHAVATGKPGEITRAVQTAFEDALHGRIERYREWLDPVPDLGRLDADRVLQTAGPDAPRSTP
jgi:branched-chain amino acid aminotransferase